MKWPTLTINDLCKVSGGKRLPSGHNYKVIKTNHPYIRITDMSYNTISTDNLLYISDETFSRISRYTISKDDLYISIAGTIGYVGKIPEYIDGANLTENCAKLSNFSNEIYRDFLLYYLRSSKGNGELLSRKGGASQPKLALERIKTVPVPVPPIEVQIRISNILSAYDDLIENNQKQIKLLEEAAMRLYKDWFVNLRFPGYETVKIVNGAPEGWSKSTVGEETSMLRRGISPKYNEKGKSIVINQKCIRQFMVSLEESRYQDKPFLEEMRLVDGDVVICSTGTGTLGRVGQIFGDLYECTFDSHVTLVRANNKIGKNYLGQALYFQQPYFENMGKGSTNQTELSKTSISLLPIVIPSERVLNDFERIVQNIREKMLCCANTIERLKLSRDKLLPKLMSGEIEV